MPYDTLRRREFLRRLAAAAATPAVALASAASAAAQVTIPSEFDLTLESTAVAFRASSGMTMGYMSQPKAAGMRPGIVLVHDVAGLTPGIRGMARNLATSGYTVVAPDFLSSHGGAASFRGVTAAVRKAVEATTAADVAARASSALAYAKSHGGSGGRGLGLLGIGWGGTHVLLFVAGRPEAAACVVFYPDPQQALPALPKIAAPVLAIFAGDDPATSDGVQKIRAGGGVWQAEARREGVSGRHARVPRSGRGQDLQARCRERGLDAGDPASARLRAHQGAGATKTSRPAPNEGRSGGVTWQRCFEIVGRPGSCYA